MLGMPIEVTIKKNDLEGIEEIIKMIDKMREVNPHNVVKATIEIDLKC